MEKMSWRKICGATVVLLSVGLWMLYVIGSWERGAYNELPFEVYYVTRYGNTPYVLSAGLPMMTYCLVWVLPAALRSVTAKDLPLRKYYLFAVIPLLTVAALCMLASTDFYSRFLPFISRGIQKKMLAFYVHTIPVSILLSVFGALAQTVARLIRTGVGKAARYLVSNGRIFVMSLVIAFITTIGSLLLMRLIHAMGYYSAVAWVFSFCRQNASVVKAAWISVVCAPVIEEIAFRGCICKGVDKVTNRWSAIMISALCFGLWHRNLGQFCYTFVWGMMYGYLVLSAGTVVWPMLIHCVSNILAILAHSNSSSNVFGAWPALYAFRGWLLELPVWSSVALLVLITALVVLLLRRISRVSSCAFGRNQ